MLSNFNLYKFCDYLTKHMNMQVIIVFQTNIIKKLLMVVHKNKNFLWNMGDEVVVQCQYQTGFNSQVWAEMGQGVLILG